jgi:hypothetical protein
MFLLMRILYFENMVLRGHRGQKAPSLTKTKKVKSFKTLIYQAIQINLQEMSG